MVFIIVYYPASHFGYFLFSHFKNKFNFPDQILPVIKNDTVFHVPEGRIEPFRIVNYGNCSYSHRFYYIMTHGHAVSRWADEKVGFR